MRSGLFFFLSTAACSSDDEQEEQEQENPSNPICPLPFEFHFIYFEFSHGYLLSKRLREDQQHPSKAQKKPVVDHHQKNGRQHTDGQEHRNAYGYDPDPDEQIAQDQMQA